MIFHLVLISIIVTTTTANDGSSGVFCNVRDYGAKGDGKTYDTNAIRNCINDCHNRSPYNSTIIMSNGVFLTGALNLTSNMALYIESAVLLGSTRSSDYPIVKALPSYGTCRDGGYPKAHELYRHQALISGWNISDNIIYGNGNSTIDGNGEIWWQRHQNNTLQYGRPRLIEPMYCNKFILHDVRLKDSAFWTTHPYACDDVHVFNVNITATGPNTDGIDPDSSKNVLIEHVNINVGDDAIAIKSGMNYAGREFNRSSENIMIRNSNFIARRVSIGSEMSGGVKNVTIKDSVIGGSGGSAVYPGLYIKTERGRGGIIEDITYSNLTGNVVAFPIYISMYYSSHVKPTNKSATPIVRDITIDNMRIKTAVSPGQIQGLPESPIENIHLQNINISTTNGWECEYVHGSAINVVPPLKECLSK